MNSMIYKNYTARIEYSDEDECFIGHIVDIHDIIGFHGDSVQGLKTAFIEAVDDYLETCKLANKRPQKSCSGHLTLTIPPEIYMAVANAAQLQGKSVNQWAIEVLFREANI